MASHVFLAALGLAANLGFLFMPPLIPLELLGLFYPGVVLTTIAGYCLVGTRFVYALTVEVSVLIAYNFVFVATHGVVPSTLFTHDFFILSANVIGGVAGYLQEWQTWRIVNFCMIACIKPLLTTTAMALHLLAFLSILMALRRLTITKAMRLEIKCCRLWQRN
jgi:hypothetical protein